jgi:mycothiol synthase
MRITEVAQPPSADTTAAVLELADRVERATGVPALSDHLRLDLTAGAGATAPTVVSMTDATGTIAFAQTSAANDSVVLEVVVDPSLSDRVEVRDDVAETAIETHRARSAAPIVWWLDDPSDHDDQVAARSALRPNRELFEMRRPLPHPDHATIETRDFVPGADDQAWLDVNNRAFAEHGEQGGWTHDTLALRMSEPWFDPAGFRIFDDGGRVVAFCWTKLHTDVEPTVGEIYVIAVDPDAHGRGLGKQLTLAGLDSIAARGVTIANLYVDAANEAAVGLYRRLGFDVHRRRVAFGPAES